MGRGSQNPTRIGLLAETVICVLTVLSGLFGTARAADVTSGVGSAPAKPLVVILPPVGPTLPNVDSIAKGFRLTGNLEKATVTGGCISGLPNSGGTATISGVAIAIPDNLIVQFPGNTLTWKETVCQSSTAPVTSADAGSFPTSVNVSVDGNIVGGGGGGGGQHVAALVFVTEHPSAVGEGQISFIDYADGSIYVTTKDISGAASEVRLLINDPAGRFGRSRSIDARFSVDDASPSVRSGLTGYPMCVPRLNDQATGQPLPQVNGVPQDPLCPAKNRPTGPVCRNFAAAGVAIPGGRSDVPATPANGYCTGFVMPAVAGFPGSVAAARNSGNIGGPNDPDPRAQAPFEVGDTISWRGILAGFGTALPQTPRRPNAPAGTPLVVWAHTVEARVGIFTQPGTLPSYVAVKGVGVAVDPQPTGASAATAVDARARFHVDAVASDIGSIIDVYLDDKGFDLPAARSSRAPSRSVGGSRATSPAHTWGRSRLRW